MTNYKSFIKRNKKDYFTHILFYTFILIVLEIIFLVEHINKWIVLIVSTIFIYKTISSLLMYYKVNVYYKKLNETERKIIEKELLTLFFEGNGFSLTENYIIDFCHLKFISYNSIDAIKFKTKYRLITLQNGVYQEEGVKIYLGNRAYTYMVNTSYIPDLSIVKFNSGDKFNLYNYIKYKNSNVKEK